MKRSTHDMTASTDRSTSNRLRRSSAFTAVASAGAVSLAVVAIAGCGSSSPTGATAVTGSGPAAAAVPVTGTTVSAPSTGAARQSGSTKTIAPKTAHQAVRVKIAHSAVLPRIVVGNPIHRPARGTGGTSINDERRAGKVSSADAGGSINPCTLVTQAQARAFTHRPVAAPTLAPLGPTCIYHELSANTQITLAVQSTAFSKLKPHIHRLSQFTIAGRTAYCGVYGSPVTYVLLAANRILSILAPCDVGTKFAAVALPKLGA
jgi:hypothetical protein